MPGSYQIKRIAFSVTNCICFDQRVLKMAATVNKLNCEITIIGRRLGDCCDSNSIPFKTRRFRMLFNKGFLFYKFYNIRLFLYLLLNKFDLIVSNDLDTLFAGFIASKIKRINLVYDSHEYFTGLPELNHRPFVRWVWKSIGNCSRMSSDIKAFTRGELKTNSDSLLLIFQGSGINIDKGGEELIEAIKITENVLLLIVGSGDVISVLKKKVNALNLADRVIFISKMPWNELMGYTKSADAGLSLEKDTNLNYRFSLPNKLFDYISAGIPVITGSLPEIRKAIIKLRDNTDLLNKLKKNSVIASESLNWENESKIVTEFYKTIL
jgi:hypothetical protein